MIPQMLIASLMSFVRSQTQRPQGRGVSVSWAPIYETTRRAIYYSTSRVGTIIETSKEGPFYYVMLQL